MIRRPLDVICVLGTRPEAIKMAPVIRMLKADPDAFRVRITVTAQHRDLLDRLLAHFDLREDDDLDVMRPDQSLPALSAALFDRLGPLLARARPDWVVVQGDTTSAMVAALSGVYAGARVAHVEAGLRTGRAGDPFPEELNRTIIARAASLHFAPTARARANLLQEGVADEAIHVTGNPGIDALHWTIARQRETGPAAAAGSHDPRTLLVTLHRRESFGEPLVRMCGALAELAARTHARARILWPVHPNPHVSGPIRARLDGVAGIDLVDPLAYPEAVALLSRCHFVMTDSGGLQEEAATLGKPALVLRDVTERPEGIEAGVAQLVGRDPSCLVRAALRLIDDEAAYAAMARAVDVYGDGRAAGRIAAALRAAARTG